MPSPAEGAPLPPVVFLVGPTGAGKSALSLALAPRLGGEIVSADSRLLYRGMDIGTAKPSAAERARVPHHLIDVTDPDDPWSLAQYQEAALAALAGIRARGRLPICVGGTGQYVRALLEGWEIPPGAPGGEFRKKLELRLAAEGIESLSAELTRRDPEAAERVDLRNPRRVIRALEVVLTTGKPYTLQRTRREVPFRPVMIGLTMPRPALYARADSRIDAMIAAGWVEEVRGLLVRGFDPALPAFSALGYGQIVRHLRGELSLAECVTAIRRATRVLIRRQGNWFRADDPGIYWIESNGEALANAQTAVKEQLSE